MLQVVILLVIVGIIFLFRLFGKDLTRSRGIGGFFANLAAYIFSHFFQIVILVGSLIACSNSFGDGEFLIGIGTVALGICVCLLLSKRSRDFLGIFLANAWIRFIQIVFVLVAIGAIVVTIFSFVGE